MAFVKRVTIVGDSPETETEENWLVFERDVRHLVDDSRQIIGRNSFVVQIAFRVSEYERDGRPNIAKLSHSYLNVFFPTEKETKLGFLVQGPYRTIPSRNSVSESDTFNISLAEETGALVVEALRWLRDRDWLSVDVLATMPLAETEDVYRYDRRRGRFGYFPTERNPYQYSLFEPIYESVKQATINEALIPAYGGGYVAAKDAKIAGSADLRKLLDRSQLQQLLDFDNQTQWLSEEITEDRAPDLWKHLTHILDVEEIDSEMFVRRIDHAFMNNQSDDWVRRFYEFAPTGSTMLHILRDRPIIRLADGSHVKPLRGNSNQAYLPKEHESRYPTVKREVCSSQASLDFLEKLGLKEPAIDDEVRALILPKYAGGQDVDQAEHLKDIDLILHALHEVDSIHRRSQLIDLLHASPFLRATNSKGDSVYRRPGEIYFRNPSLMVYFEGNPDAWFLSEKYDDFRHYLRQLDIREKVRVSLKRPDRSGYVRLSEPWGNRGSRDDPYVGGQHGFDPDFTVDGLEYSMNHPSTDRAQFIWNCILSDHMNSISGMIVKSTRVDFSAVFECEPTDSTMGKLVLDSAWLPDGRGNYVKPSELSLEDLPDGFRKDRELANALGLRRDETSIQDLLERDDIEDSVKQRLALAIEFSLEDLKLMLNHPDIIEQLRKNKREPLESLDPERYGPELQEKFRSRDNAIPNTPNPTIPTDYAYSPETTPEDRLLYDIENEPTPEDRFQLGIRRIWRPRNPETRKFLEREYEGRCQICDYTFEQRNRTYYFEAVHLIQRIRGDWADDYRNAICLCANHSAQFQHGELSTPEDDILEQIISPQNSQDRSILIMLCGEPQLISFSGRHIDEFRGLLGDAGDL